MVAGLAIMCGGLPLLATGCWSHDWPVSPSLVRIECRSLISNVVLWDPIMFQVLKPPASLDAFQTAAFKVFLAGSIEMGGAQDWQSTVSQSLQNENMTVLNPRRDEWDSTWKQTISNPKFRDQVEWELSALEIASMVAIYFEPSTKSPVTLLELGLFARSDKVVVCCSDGFWRKGNVEVVCAKFNVPMVDSLNDLIDAIRSKNAECQ